MHAGRAEIDFLDGDLLFQLEKISGQTERPELGASVDHHPRRDAPRRIVAHRHERPEHVLAPHHLALGHQEQAKEQAVRGEVLEADHLRGCGCPVGARQERVKVGYVRGDPLHR